MEFKSNISSLTNTHNPPHNTPICVWLLLFVFLFNSKLFQSLLFYINAIQLNIIMNIEYISSKNVNKIENEEKRIESYQNCCLTKPGEVIERTQSHANVKSVRHAHTHTRAYARAKTTLASAFPHIERFVSRLCEGKQRRHRFLHSKRTSSDRKIVCKFWRRYNPYTHATRTHLQK